MECVYSITCPETNNIVYVGSTKNFFARGKTHLAGIEQTPIGKYMKYLRDKNLFADIKVLDTDIETETFWIQQMKSWGMPLLNVINYYKIQKQDKGRISKRNNFTLSYEAQCIIDKIPAKDKSRYVSDAIVNFIKNEK